MSKPVDADTIGRTDGRSVCAHLGLEEDPFTRCLEPSARHRCYLWMQRTRIDLSHQQRFCLTSSHNICPWLSVSTPLSVQLDSRAVRLRHAAGAVLTPLGRRAVALAKALWIRLRPVLAKLGLLAAHLAAALWHRLRLAMVRSARFLASRARDGLLGLGRFVARLGPLAVGGLSTLGARAWSGLRSLPRRPSLSAASDEDRAGRPPLSNDPGVVDQPPLSNGEAVAGQPAENGTGMADQTPTSTAPAEPAGAANQPPASTEPAAPPAPKYAPPVPALAGASGPSILFSGRPLVKAATISWQCAACEAINASPSQACRACGHPSPEVEEMLTSSGDALLAQGLAGLKAGDEELAHLYFVKACKASPKSETAWYWRAKTSPTLDEVIDCMEHILKLSPGNAKVQADLNWALQRRQREQHQPAPVAAPSKRRSPAAPGLPRRVIGALRWLLLQLAGVSTFLLALALTIPYGLRFVDLAVRSEFEAYAKLLPGVGLPELPVQTPYLAEFDLGPALPLILGLLLLHAAFAIVDGGGPVARVWTALLGAAAGGLMLLFGTNPPASLYAAALAAVAIAAALVGGAPATKIRTYR